MHAFALHYWVSVRGVSEAETVRAAFMHERDAKTWASVQSAVHNDTRDVWHCYETQPATKIKSYHGGKIVA